MANADILAHRQVLTCQELLCLTNPLLITANHIFINNETLVLYYDLTR